jgi:hypothetical protein
MYRITQIGLNVRAADSGRPDEVRELPVEWLQVTPKESPPRRASQSSLTAGNWAKKRGHCTLLGYLYLLATGGGDQVLSKLRALTEHGYIPFRLLIVGECLAA